MAQLSTVYTAASILKDSNNLLTYQKHSKLEYLQTPEEKSSILTESISEDEDTRRSTSSTAAANILTSGEYESSDISSIQESDDSDEDIINYKLEEVIKPVDSKLNTLTNL